MTTSVVSIGELVPMIKDKLSSGGKVTIKVKGTSMRPFLKSEVTDVHLSQYYGELNRYDIILYEHPNETVVLHRYIKTKNNHLLLCGDALMKCETIQENQIIGRVFAYTENGKKTNVTNKKYLRKVSLWVLFKPIRPILLKLVRLFWRR